MAYGAGFGGVEMDDPIINDRSRNLLHSRQESLASIRSKFPGAFPHGEGNDERALT